MNNLRDAMDHVENMHDELDEIDYLMYSVSCKNQDNISELIENLYDKITGLYDLLYDALDQKEKQIKNSH